MPDILASAGIDLNEILAGINKLNERVSAIEPAAKKASDSLVGIEKSSKSAAGSIGFMSKALGALAGLFAIRKVAQFGGDVINAGINLNDAARKANVTVEAFQALQIATSDALSKDEFTGSIDAITNAMDAARSGSVEMSEALRELGVSAASIQKNKPDEAFLQIAEQADKAGTSVAQLNKIFGDNARAIKEASKGGAGAIKGRMEGAGGMSGEAASALKETSRFFGRIKDRFVSGAGNIAGMIADVSKQAASGDFLGVQAELKRKQEAEKKTAISSTTQNKEAVVDLAAAERDRLAVIEKSAFGMEDQKDIQLAEIGLLQQQLQVAEKVYGINSLIALAIREQIHQHDLNYQQLDHEIEQADKQAKNQTNAMRAELADSKLLTEQAKIHAEFETKIADAIHNRQGDVANELRKQQKLAELNAAVNQGIKTPAQQRNDRREQEERDHQIRMQANRMDHPNAIDASGRFHVSASAERARRKIMGLPDNTPLSAFDRINAARFPKAIAERAIKPVIPGSGKNEVNLMRLDATNIFVREFRVP